VVWAVAAVGVLALAAPGQQKSDPAVARLLRELQAWDGEPVTIARAQAQAGDPAAARATLQRAIAHASDARGLLAIEQVQAEMGDRDAALKTLLMARNSDLVGPSRALATATISVNGRVERLDPDLAARVTNRQIPRTLPDIAIEQFRLGDRAAAKATFEQALRSARTLEPDDRRWAIVQVIAARAEAGDFDAALKDVASLAGRAERFEALTQINLRDRVVDTTVLGRILRMIDADGVPPKLPQDSILNPEELLEGPLLGRDNLQTLIAVARAEAGDITGAIRLANTIKHIQVQGDALAGIAAAQAASGDIKGALETAGTIRPPDPKQGLITHLRDQWDALREIAAAQARAGDVAGALATADRLGPRELRLNAWIVIAEELGRRNHAGRRAGPPAGPDGRPPAILERPAGNAWPTSGRGDL